MRARPLVVLTFIASILPVTPCRTQPLSPRIANYTISVSLDPAARTLTGNETLAWRNHSRAEVRELRFHLYLNAFKNSQSTFMIESHGQVRGSALLDGNWGWIRIDSLRAAGGEDLTSRMQFIHPDDDNALDETVVSVSLPKAVPPNESLTLNIRFTARLPGVIARTGYYGDFFMVAQWFPKIGVYEVAGERYATHGQWNCHQFHYSTEFYADFGVYDVLITLPDQFVTGACGTLVGEKHNPDGTKTLRYVARDVHDFAWTASPHFLAVERQWRHVHIMALMQPQHIGLAERFLQSATAALDFFDAHVGPYPYGTLTILDPASGAGGAAGMEYPTLFTADAVSGFGEALRFEEVVTLHEFGHQYWYGMVASNETEEAWLDEGITQYYETRMMDEIYGAHTSLADFAGLCIGDFELTRSGYTGMHNPRMAPITTLGWKFPSGGYGPLTYYKTATVLTTLERMIGKPAMDSVMKMYFNRWKFRHPCGRDFISVVNEVAPRASHNRYGKDLDWFFDQLLYGTGVCDYELTSIRTINVGSPRGIDAYHGDHHAQSGAGEQAGERMIDSRVMVSRLGEVTIPVTVLIHFSNGEEQREWWDGQERTVEFTYRRPVGVLWARVDPDMVLAIDVNVVNNSKTVEESPAPIWNYTGKFLFWIQHLLQCAAILG